MFVEQSPKSICHIDMLLSCRLYQHVCVLEEFKTRVQVGINIKYRGICLLSSSYIVVSMIASNNFNSDFKFRLVSLMVSP